MLFYIFIYFYNYADTPNNSGEMPVPTDYWHGYSINEGKLNLIFVVRLFRAGTKPIWS